MSHINVYDRGFIVTSKGVLPMVLVGESDAIVKINGHESPMRRWAAICPPSDEETLQKNVSVWGHSDLYQFRGARIGSFANWTKNGIKRAATLDRYRLTNPNFCLICFVTIPTEEDPTITNRYLTSICSTSARLEKWLAEATAFIENNPGAEMQFLAKPANTLRVPAPASGPVYVKIKGQYVLDYIKGKSVKLSRNPEKAIRFDSPEDALDKLGEFWDQNGPYLPHEFEIVK